MNDIWANLKQNRYAVVGVYRLSSDYMSVTGYATYSLNEGLLEPFSQKLQINSGSFRKATTTQTSIHALAYKQRKQC